MTTYNTGNPVESADPLDLYDNAQDLDARLNSSALFVVNRLGEEIKTWNGIESEAVGEAIAAAEAAVAAIDITKPYIASTQPASVELGNSTYESFSSKKVSSTENNVSSEEIDSSECIKRVLYGATEFEMYHENEFPIDFTPVAPQLLIGTTYTSDPAYTERVYQGCPTIAKTGTRLWASFRGDIQLKGGLAENTGNFTTICTSVNGGVSWSEYGYIRYVGDDTRGVYDPVMWTAPDGRLWVFVTVDGNEKPTDGIFGIYAFVCKNPHDLNAVALQWETPVKILPFGFASDTPKIIDGKALIVINYWDSLLDHHPVYSKFVGKKLYELDQTTKKLKFISNLPDAIDSSTFDETFIAQSASGIVRAIWRTAGGADPTHSQETALSSDGGKTWGAAAKYTALGDNPSSRAWLGMSPSGRMVCAYNNNATLRQNLTIAFSDDGGVTWPHKKLLENQPSSSSYPYVTFDGDTVMIIYDKGRSTAGQRKILLGVVSESAVVSGISTVSTYTVSDKGYV